MLPEYKPSCSSKWKFGYLAFCCVLACLPGALFGREALNAAIERATIKRNDATASLQADAAKTIKPKEYVMKASYSCVEGSALVNRLVKDFDAVDVESPHPQATEPHTVFDATGVHIANIKRASEADPSPRVELLMPCPGLLEQHVPHDVQLFDSPWIATK